MTLNGFQVETASSGDKIEEIVESILLPSKILGLFWFRLEGGKYIRCKWLTLASASVTFLITIGLISTYLVGTPIPRTGSATLLMTYIESALLVLLSIVAVLETRLNIASFNEAINLAKDVNKIHTALSPESKLSSYNISFKSVHTFNFFMVVSVVVTGGVELFVHDNFTVIYVLHYLFYSAILAQMSFLTSRYFGIVFVCGVLYENCSKELISFRIRPSGVSCAQGAEILIGAYEKVSKMATIICNIYKYQVLLIILSSFTICLTETYELLVSYSTSDVTGIIVKIPWICGCAFIIHLMVAACSDCSDKAKEFNLLLYQLMIDDKTNEISNNQKLRLHITMKREVVFTACGFFTLDYTLVQSMVAAATTYLVILIQFGSPSQQGSLQPAVNGTEPGPSMVPMSS